MIHKEIHIKPDKSADRFERSLTLFLPVPGRCLDTNPSETVPQGQTIRFAGLLRFETAESVHRKYIEPMRISVDQCEHLQSDQLHQPIQWKGHVEKNPLASAVYLLDSEESATLQSLDNLCPKVVPSELFFLFTVSYRRLPHRDDNTWTDMGRGSEPDRDQSMVHRLKRTRKVFPLLSGRTSATTNLFLNY